MSQHVGVDLNGILAAMPVRSTSFYRPDTVNGAPRSLTKMNGDLAWRLAVLGGAGLLGLQQGSTRLLCRRGM